jgi:hemoglobin
MRKVLLAVVLTVGCAHGENKAADSGNKSLYDRLGGKDAITAVVDDFVGRVAKDNRINARFATADIPNLKAKLVEQICMATGGPCTYSGKDMKMAHKGMNLKDEEFGALVEDLQGTLNQFKVGDQEQKELIGALGGMKGDVVGQ